MPDWIALVREHLGDLSLPESQRDEVVVEIASHLEHRYEEQIALGRSECEAFEMAVRELGDGDRLTRRLRRAKGGNMTKVTRQFLLPGLVAMATLHLFWFVWALAERSASVRLMNLRVIDMGFMIVPIFVPLLVASPIFGALGAYLSLRAGGAPRAIIASGLLPVLGLPFGIVAVLATSWLAGWPVILTTPHAAPRPALPFAVGSVAVFVLQAVALYIGTLPFLRASKPSPLTG